MKPTFALTLGDPLGIGPEIVQKALLDPKIEKLAHWRIYGSQPLKKKMTPKACGKASWQSLESAVNAIKNGECHGLVTAPVSKVNLKKVGFPFPGQTEYLSKKFGAKKTTMMLCSKKLKVVLVTIHIPLKKVFSQLSSDKIFEKILIAYYSLKTDFGIFKPRIAVCGLNPHAGEEGTFGHEEKIIIVPAILKAKKKGIQVSGPFASDTVFHQAAEGKYDVVICHYHDQGLIPLKTLSFHTGVNTTLGLPIIRTSPDHGTAFDIAGKGRADPSSMKEAMQLAVSMWKKRQL